MNRINRMLCIAIALTAATAAAYAQSSAKFNVPFGFQAGHKAMPAGTYRIDTSNENKIVWVSGTRHTVALASYVLPSDNASLPRMVFHRYGNEFFLAQIWTGEAGSVMAPTAREKELANAGVPRALTVIHLAIHK